MLDVFLFPNIGINKDLIDNSSEFFQGLAMLSFKTKPQAFPTVRFIRPVGLFQHPCPVCFIIIFLCAIRDVL